MTDETVVPAEPAAPAAPAAPESSAPAESSAAAPSEPVSRRDTIARAMDAPAKPAQSGREPSGRFAPKADAQAAAPPAKKERRYPSSFKPDYKPVFDELSANEKYHGFLDDIERREGDYHKGLEPYKEASQYAQSMRTMLQPYQAVFQQMNTTPEAAVNALLRTDYALRSSTPEQKLEHLKRLARDYGVDLGGEGGEPAAQQQVDPHVLALWQRQQQTERVLQQYETQRQHQEFASAQSAVTAFSTAPGHEFFEEVRSAMGDLIDKGLVKDINEAYDWAVWSNPAIRAKVLAKQQSGTETKRKEDARRSVEAAKTAGVQIKGAPSSGNSDTRQPSGRNRRETIARLMERSV